MIDADSSAVRERANEKENISLYNVLKESKEKGDTKASVEEIKDAKRPLAQLVDELQTKNFKRPKQPGSVGDTTFYSRVVGNNKPDGIDFETKTNPFKAEKNTTKTAPLGFSEQLEPDNNSNSVDAYSALLNKVGNIRLPDDNPESERHHPLSPHEISDLQAEGFKAKPSSSQIDWEIKVSCKIESPLHLEGSERAFAWVSKAFQQMVTRDTRSKAFSKLREFENADEDPVQILLNNSTYYCYPVHKIPDDIFDTLCKCTENPTTILKSSNHARFSTFIELMTPEDEQTNNRSTEVSSMGTTVSTGSSDRQFLFNREISRDPSSRSNTFAFSYERKCNWGRAFQSIFTKLKHLKAQYFYYVEGSFVCLFLAKGVLRDEQFLKSEMPMCAIISRTKRSIRKQLEDFGVRFEMPLLRTESYANTQAGKPNDEIIDELKAYRSEAANGFGAKVDSKLVRGNSIADDCAKSLVSVSGSINVAKLYQFLFARVVKRGILLTDVPRIYATTDFENASLKSIDFIGPLTGFRDDKKLKLLKLEGFLLPSQHSAILKAISLLERNIELEVITKPLEDTKNFNSALNMLSKQYEIEKPKHNE